MKNRIRVVCEDGILVDITDAESGAVIPGVRGVTFNAPKPGQLATVTLECFCARVDVLGELAVIECVETKTGERRRFVLPPGWSEEPPKGPGLEVDMTTSANAFRVSQRGAVAP